VRTIVIVDDHDTFRAAARQLLDGAGFLVVGEAVDADSAVEAVARLHPDVLLLDVVLPDRDGFAVIEALQQLGTLPQTVLVSSRHASTFRGRLAASAARGFVSKSDLTRDAVEALLT
jgi:DNA-binding NarL/FixJ family response regulator